MTSSTSSLVRIWKIHRSSPKCSFVWTLRVVYCPLKHSCLYNNPADVIDACRTRFLESWLAGYYSSRHDLTIITKRWEKSGDLSNFMLVNYKRFVFPQISPFISKFSSSFCDHKWITAGESKPENYACPLRFAPGQK